MKKRAHIMRTHEIRIHGKKKKMKNFCTLLCLSCFVAEPLRRVAFCVFG